MTDQEIIDAVQDRAHELAVLGRHTEAQKLYAAAERIRVLGEECEATRAYDAHEEGSLDQYDMGKSEALYFAVTDARAATDAARRGA